jgi:hypothetical protein
MKPLSLHPIVKEGFSLTARHEGNVVWLKIKGNGDMETPATLGSYLKKIHTETLRLRAHSVSVECDELYFMSSACIKCLVTWIDGVLKLDPMERYKVKFQANPNLPWQRRSFEALRRFAPALVYIDSDSVPRTPTAQQSGTIAQASTITGAAAPLEPAAPAARRKP